MLMEIQALSVGYQGRAILPPVDLQVQPGELWAVIGPNGAGKSTFLRTILNLQPPVAGHVQRAMGTVGYVPQRAEVSAVVPQRVVDLVRMGADRGWRILDPLGMRSKIAVQQAMRDADVLGLAKTPWHRLSEGQKQRALMAQALAGEPNLLLLDEPTAAMDVQAESAVFTLLERLRTERQLGIVVVSHHLALLAKYATHFLLLDGDARLALVAEREVMLKHPAFIQRYGQVVPRGGPDA